MKQLFTFAIILMSFSSNAQEFIGYKLGKYVNNIKTGQGMEFYDTTETIYYGEFLNGKRQGLGVYFNKLGTLEIKGSWENGILKTSF